LSVSRPRSPSRKDGLCVATSDGKLILGEPCSVAEVRSSEVGPVETRAPELGRVQIRSFEIRTREG